MPISIVECINLLYYGKSLVLLYSRHMDIDFYKKIINFKKSVRILEKNSFFKGFEEFCANFKSTISSIFQYISIVLLDNQLHSKKNCKKIVFSLFY